MSIDLCSPHDLAKMEIVLRTPLEENSTVIPEDFVKQKDLFTKTHLLFSVLL